jgi:HAD superfamily hydrolase (TIGR01509 family)
LGNYTAAIFDLDGTLLDSLNVWEQVDIDFLKKRGLPLARDYTEAVSAMSFEEAARYTIERFGLKETEEELMREWNEMVAHEYAHRIKLKPGARECLQFLQKQNFKLGVATALPKELYVPALQNNGILDDFHVFASVTETKRGKGFPDIYLLCARRLGIPPEKCLVFEDVLPGLQGAKAAGMGAIGVFDKCSNLSEQDALSVADGYIQSLAEVTKAYFNKIFS